MDEQAHGIVLRTRPLTETSLIVEWLTEAQGRLATVAKGARRPKSPLRGKLDLFFVVRFSFQRSRRSELHTLRELTLLQTFPHLRQSLASLQQGSYVVRLLERVTERDTPIPTLFHLLANFLDSLNRLGPSPLNLLLFESRLLEDLGLAPDWDQARLDPGAQALWHRARQLDTTQRSSLKPSPTQLEDLDRLIRRYLLQAVDPIPQGRPLP